VSESAQILGLPPAQIFPVSAQKGLVAKVNKDNALLERSRLPELERALSHELIPAKQEVVREATEGEFAEIYEHAHALLEERLFGLREQLGELGELRGKNKGVVKYLIGKVKMEKDEFETGLQRFYAVRSVFSKLTNRLFEHLGADALRGLTESTRQAMLDATFSSKLSDAMRGFFDGARAQLTEAEADIDEILEMMTALQKKFVVEHGLKLSNPSPFSLVRHKKEIDRMERWCDSHLNTTFQLLAFDKKLVTQRFFDGAAHQVRRLFGSANRDAETWSKVLIAPMETQIRERQVQLKRRLDSIKRIHQATDTLEERINELLHGECELLDQTKEVENAGEAVRRVLRARVASATPLRSVSAA